MDSVSADIIRAHLTARYLFTTPESLGRAVQLGMDARACGATDLRDFYTRFKRHYPRDLRKIPKE